MSKYVIPHLFQLQDIPEFQRFQAANPDNCLDAYQTALMYGRAIHWMSILEILWPDFATFEDNVYTIEVAYIVCNDPDDDTLPDEFYQQIAMTIATFWRIQLDDLYPNGDWKVEIWPDDEITIQAVIYDRGG